MKIIIVGGDFGTKKESKIISKLSSYFNEPIVLNGGKMNDLPSLVDGDLTIWMPNIPNEEPKNYPIKSNGNVLICSKVMRDGYKKIDAVERIFRMHGNAVIAITKSEQYNFEIIDALANTWYCGSSIEELYLSIIKFYDFTKRAIRKNTIKSDLKQVEIDSVNVGVFLDINRNLSNYIQNSCGERFFGNVSTRCQKLFPSLRSNYILVSPRNIDKKSIQPTDMVQCYKNDSTIYYIGDRKPSVDTPVQLEIYDNCPNVNYIIHGHAFIDNAPTTDEYYLCGDFREFYEVYGFIKNNKFGFLNLKNHGFIIYSDTLDNLRYIIGDLTFNFKK